MFAILLMLGIVLAAAGLVAIGFGIPINAFSLGNTLIMSGTTAVAGGFILIGLAAAVRQLNRIATAMAARPTARQGRPVEGVEPPAVPPTARLTPAPAAAPAAPLPRAATHQPAPAEPRIPLTPQAEAPSQPPLEWLRQRPKASSNGEPPVVEVPDEAPLSPRVPHRPAFSPLANMAEPAHEPKVWSPSRSESADAKRSSRADHVARATPPGERGKESAKDSAKDTGLFQVNWPDAKPEQPAADRDAASDTPSHRLSEEPAAERREASSERTPAILKSGVIDGMAYTLYTDGSIEADLPQGTVKFASVDALRAHLEKHA